MDEIECGEVAQLLACFDLSKVGVELSEPMVIKPGQHILGAPVDKRANALGWYTLRCKLVEIKIKIKQE